MKPQYGFQPGVNVTKRTGKKLRTEEVWLLMRARVCVYGQEGRPVRYSTSSVIYHSSQAVEEISLGSGTQKIRGLCIPISILSTRYCMEYCLTKPSD